MRQAEFPQEQEREKAHPADFHSLFRGLMDNAESHEAASSRLVLCVQAKAKPLLRHIPDILTHYDSCIALESAFTMMGWIGFPKGRDLFALLFIIAGKIDYLFS